MNIMSNKIKDPTIKFTRHSIAIWLKKHYRFWLALPWLVLLLTAMAGQFYLGFKYNSNETTTIYLQVARACAYTLLLVLTILWLPVMRHGLAALWRSRWTSWLPLTQAKNLHRWLGHVLLIASLVHGSCYLIYFNSLNAPLMATIFAEEPDLVRSMKTTMYEFVSEDESIDDVIDWIALGMPEALYNEKIHPIMKEDCTKCHSTSSTMTYAIGTLPLSKYDDVVSLSQKSLWSRQFRINVTGIVMLLLVIALWISSLKYMRKRYHHVFQQTHKLGYLMVILALMHIPRYSWLILPCLILAIEYIFSHYLRIYYDQEAKLVKVSATVMTLTLARPEKFIIQTGHYLQLRIPGIKRFEWHDFSLTGQRNDKDLIVLKIKVQGDWTQALYQQNSQDTLKVDIRGPFASPAAYIPKSEHCLMVAGGIGITPFLGFMHALSSNTHKIKQYHLIWVLRDSALLSWLKPFINSPVLGGHIHIFLTQTDDKHHTDWLDLYKPDNISIYQRRPDWAELFNQLHAENQSIQNSKVENNHQHLTLDKPHCFVCGPLSMTQTVTKLCQNMGWPVSVEQF